jgi:hypothetical protein
VMVLKPGFGILLRTGTVRGQNFIRLLLFLKVMKY